MTKRHSAGIPVSIGGPSVLVVFVALFLATFGVLMLVTANSEHKLAKTTAATVENTYAADTRAQELMRDIDRVWQRGGRPDALQALPGVTQVVADGAGLDVHFETEAVGDIVARGCLHLEGDRADITQYSFANVRQAVYDNDEYEIFH